MSPNRQAARRVWTPRIWRAKCRPWLLGWLWTMVLRGLHATWRVETQGLEAFDQALADGRGVIAAFWHGSYIPLFALLKNRNAVIFTSLSARGAVIAEICRHFGYRAVQIPDHGGDASLATMARTLATAPAAGLAVDGPLGPRHEVKRGAIQLAGGLGWCIYPIAVALRPKRVLAGRWDRREIPWPWSRVALVVGEPLEPEREPDLMTWQRRVGEALEIAGRRASELLCPEGQR